MMIKEMRSEDKPRERFAKAPDTASMVDLVAILLRTGRHGCSVMDMAQEVVEQIRFPRMSMDLIIWIGGI